MRFTPMNPEYKAKWLKALRSGEYEQGRICLRNKDNRMCCLGVLCDIIDPTEWTRSLGGYTFRGNSHFPDASVNKETGLSMKKCEVLAEKNDSDRWSFSQISDFIEKEF